MICRERGEKMPTDDALHQLHHAAHEACFLANSVKTQIDVEGSWAYDAAS